MTHTASPVSRLLAIVACAMVTAACAARTIPTVRGPQPFPMVSPPASLRPAPARGPTVPLAAADVLRTALGYRGVPYRLGGDTPEVGFDCSGFIRYVLARHAVDVPRTAAEQFQVGRSITAQEVQAGDLVFFSTIAPGASHVGLALNATEFVHAPAASGVVRVEPLQSAYWRERFIGARRLFSE